MKGFGSKWLSPEALLLGLLLTPAAWAVSRLRRLRDAARAQLRSEIWAVLREDRQRHRPREDWTRDVEFMARLKKRGDRLRGGQK